MTLDPAHQSTLVALAAIQREREELARYVERLRMALREIIADGTAGTLGDVLSRRNRRAARCVEIARAALAGEIEPQDPIADAAEDEAFRVAVARMDAAEAREDAADAKAKGTA